MTAEAAGACCPSVLDAPLTEPDEEDLARLFAALADPVRLRLLSLVAAAGEVCSCNLLEQLDRSQPTISHHTKLLADAGLITGEKRPLGLVARRFRSGSRQSTRHWHRRSQRRRAGSGSVMTTLDALDLPLAGPSAWQGGDLVDSNEWIHELTASEIGELDNALAAVNKQGLTLAEIGRQDFQLSELSETIAAWAARARHRPRLPAGARSPGRSATPRQRRASSTGGSVGTSVMPVSQNTDGDLLGHVRDTGADPRTRPSVSTGPRRAAVSHRRCRHRRAVVPRGPRDRAARRAS